MKKLTTLIAILLCTVSLIAQAPEKFTYQAVVRNASNSLVSNAQVGVRMSLLQGSATGNAVYVETQSTTTNTNGLLSVEIGGGTAQQGTFANIDWANGPYFLKTEIDPNGSTNYSITSTQQMLSVPYALYAKESGNGFSGDYNDLTNTPTIPTVPTNVSAFTNDAGYLTGYTETDPQYNAWNKDYNDLINRPTIPTVPTNVSAFTNDVPYLVTEQQILSISNDTIFLTGGSFVKLPTAPAGFSGNYEDLTNTPTIPTNVSQLENDANYITINDIPEIPTVPDSVSAFINDAGYLTNALCDTENFCQLVQMVRGLIDEVASLRDSLEEIKNTMVRINVPTVVMDSVSTATGEISACASILNDGGSQIIECGICWSYEENPTLDDNARQDNNQISSSFCHTIGNIEFGRDIHVRAYAANAAGISYSNDTVLVILNPYEGQPCPGSPNMTDADGNVYPTVQIGNQCWITENLRTTQNNAVHFQVGECGGAVNPSCFVPRNDPSVVDTYGYLYNWAAISGKNGPVTNDSTYCQGICPDGWHVPSSFDWQKLLNYVESKPNYGWISLLDSVFVTYGTNTAPNVNRSGLSLRSSGYCFSCYMYQFSYIGQWTSSFGCYNSTYPCNMEGLSYNNFGLSTGMPAYDCMAVRCIKTPDDKIFSGNVNIGNYFFTNDTLVVEIAGITATGSPITEVGACWSDGGLCINLYNAQTTPYDPSHSGPIYIKLPNVNTTGSIYFKAFINLEAGTIYSDMITLTVPSVNTTEPTNITDSTASVGGMITNDGGYDVTACGVCWSTSQNPTVEGDHTVEVAEAGNFTSLLTGLNAGTTYYARAYATNQAGTTYGNEVSLTTTSVSFESQPCPTTPTVTDIDGNVYNTVQIGNQCWMKENLRTTHYADGTSISLGSGSSTSIPYYYNDENSTTPLYYRGYHYNWAAVMHGAASSDANPSGVQGVCPTGWHVPSDAEWLQLTDYVRSVPEYVCSDDNNIAKALAADTLWNISNSNTCAVGNNLSANNATGFSMVPAGLWFNFGYYYGSSEAYFCSSTTNESNEIWIYNINAWSWDINRYTWDEDNGYSVRCLRNY